MKTPEELNAIKEEVEAMKKKLADLTEEELAQVSGGGEYDPRCPLKLSAPNPNLCNRVVCKNCYEIYELYYRYGRCGVYGIEWEEHHRPDTKR